MRQQSSVTHRLSLTLSVVVVAVAISIAARRPVPSEADEAIPVGVILPYGGDTVPTGWLACDGWYYKKSEYPELYRAYGTLHGDGRRPAGTSGAGQQVGEGYFNVPDCRGRFLRGVDSVRTATGAAGRDPGPRTAPYDTVAAAIGVGAIEGDRTALPKDSSFIATAAGAHFHDISTGFTVRTGSGGQDITRLPWMASGQAPPGQYPTRLAGAHTHAIAGGDRETRPQNVAVQFIVKAGRRVP